MDYSNLLNALKTGSPYLFLGQNYLEQYIGKDTFLRAIQDEFLKENSSEGGYVLLKTINASIDINNTLMWMKAKSDRIAVPDRLDIISKIAWSGVITSAFDTIVSRAFSNNWRDVNEVTSYKSKSTEVFTNKKKLNVAMLFGNVNQDTAGDYPPFDRIGFTKAMDRAKRLLACYSPDTISPYGVFIIDGYDPKKDWLKPEDLFTVLMNLDKEQVHYFGVKEPITDDHFNELISAEIMITHKEDFCEFLSNSSLNGMIDLENIDSDDFGTQKRIMINNTSKIIPKKIYDTISEGAIVLEDSILLKSNNIDKEKEKEEIQELFRKFLYYSSVKPFWDGYKYKFNLKRTFEKKFYEEIDKQIHREFDLKPLVLHGQSGSSKSISLANGAYKIKCDRKYPVLFIPKLSNEIDMNSINNFCKWCEDNGADKVIIFWDASFMSGDIGRCIDLNNYLVSKGRKVFIICSAYKVSEIKKINATFIESTAELDEIEKKDLVELFDKFTNKKSELERILESDDIDNILLLLYRLLPASRTSIRTGIVREAHSTELTLGKLLGISTNNCNLTAMEIALLKAGVLVPNRLYESENLETDLINIINLVSIPGQFNIKIPLELVFRTLKLSYKVEVAKLIDEIDFLRISQNSSGFWELSTRNYIEAEIVIKSHLSSIKEQVKLINNLIENVKYTEYYGLKSELDFIVELLKEIGPNGKNSNYSDFYFEIAKNIREIRLECGISNARTILQESSYIREYVKMSATENETKKLEELKNSEKTLRDEIEAIEERRKTNENQVKGYLMVELVSNLGAQIKVICRQKLENTNKLVFEIIDEICKIVKRMIHSQIKILYAADVLVWASAEIVKLKISEEQKSDVYCEVIFILELIEFADLGVVNTEELNMLYLKVNETFGEISRAEDYFHKLVEQGSAKGIYLHAKNNLASVNLNNNLSDESLIRCREIIEFLSTHKKIVFDDVRCLYMLLKLLWITNSGTPMFYKEKIALPFSKELWTQIVFITERISNLSDKEVNAYLLYIQSVAYFHIDKIEESIQIFKKIRDDFFVGKRRIILSYVASENDGSPKKYTGKLRNLTDDKAVIYVNELRKEVPYYNRNFVSQTPDIDTNYSDFNIGFNFLGLQVTNIFGDGGKN